VFEAFSAEVVKIRNCVPGMDRAALHSLACSVSHIRAGLDALEASVVCAVDGLGDDGPGASALLRSSSRCSQREADKRSKRAAGLEAMPKTTQALQEGRITAEHVDALVRAAEETSPEAVDNSPLVGDAARRPADLTARDARAWANRHRNEADTQSRHERQRAHRKLFIFRGDGEMVVLHGEFDAVTGAELESMIDAETNVLFQADGGRGVADKVRTPEQRRADAFVSLLSSDRMGGVVAEGTDPSIDGHNAGSSAARRRRPSQRHQIVVVADLGAITGAEPNGRCEVVGGDSIPQSVLQRLACNSELFGAVFSGPGQPLWHGRGVRMASDAQLRTLMVRDQGCVLCGKSPRWCEAHHVVPWHGPGRGPTDIDNLVLICSHHHHLIHDHRWRLERSKDGSWTVSAPESRPPPEMAAHEPVLLESAALMPAVPERALLESVSPTDSRSPPSESDVGVRPRPGPW